MANFSTFIESLRSEDNYGKKFEYFVRWFLTNDLYWKSQVSNIWMWDDYPERWGPDCGIDLVFNDHSGLTWAVQAKCYDADHQISKSDVDKFLSESNRNIIDRRLLIASTNRLGRNAIQVCKGQDKPVIRFLLGDFESSNLNYPESFSLLVDHTAPTKAKPTPRPHQIEAINAVTAGFMLQDRGQLIMACGTGKTLTSLWISEQIGAKTTLVLVPSLSLLSQTLYEWIYASRGNLQTLCVCSDDTVAKPSEDNLISSTFDLGIPVTSSVTEIARFLTKQKSNNKVIFCTYQSSELISQCQKELGGYDFDLLISDEAHRCAGKKNTVFSASLDNEFISATKRLFVTATPRFYTPNVKSTVKNWAIELIGMDDTEVFGSVLFALNFGEAIDRGLLTDYRLVICGVDQDSVLESIETRQLISLDNVVASDAELLGTQVALLKAIKEFELKSIISFHNRVLVAEEFAESLLDVFNVMKNVNKPETRMITDHISGKMNSANRKLKLNQLRHGEADVTAVITNARCLSEGIDVPALDGVCFADPRSSSIDIIQAVGRAIRRSETKSMGYIIVPIFIGSSSDEISPRHYDHVWTVINAMKSHDERLDTDLRNARFHLGKRSNQSVSRDLSDHLIIDFPKTVSSEFTEAFTLKIIERSTEVWDETLGRLERFKAEHGHLRVPYYFDDIDGYKLGQRVVNIRNTKDYLDEQKISALNQLGFIWNEMDQKWLDFKEALMNFKAREGHVEVSHTHMESGYPLGATLMRYRTIKRAEQQSQFYVERIKELDDLGVIWDPMQFAWDKGYDAVVQFLKSEGHLSPPRRYKLNGVFLSRWLTRQRETFDELSQEKQDKLRKLGFQTDPNADSWNNGFELLKEYKAEHGNCDVPQRYIHDKFKLGVWCANQRKQYLDKKLTDDRIQDLETLGFIWNPVAAQFDNWLRLLKEYKDTHGTCKVPKRFEFKGKKLGEWVSSMRSQRKNGKLSDERLAALEKLEFYWD